MQKLFDDNLSGAIFSECGKYRYSLWRVWDDRKPLVTFIGLNPSTANADTDDATIKRVIQISKNNGYGGVYMVNCFPFISTDPDKMKGVPKDELELNKWYVFKAWAKSKDVVFAWGNFNIVKEEMIDDFYIKMFPGAKALYLNKNGSPKHPLYCKIESKFINFK